MNKENHSSAIHTLVSNTLLASKLYTLNTAILISFFFGWYQQGHLDKKIFNLEFCNMKLCRLISYIIWDWDKRLFSLELNSMCFVSYFNYENSIFLIHGNLALALTRKWSELATNKITHFTPLICPRTFKV